jgi:hypothetical protein
MENHHSSSDDEEQLTVRKFHCTINCFHKKNDDLSVEKEKKVKRRRSSSIKLKNLVPKLKPINTVLCPSPIELNQKVPHPPPVLLRTQFALLSTISYYPEDKLLKNECEEKKTKKSLKIMNIEEDKCSISDYGDSSKKIPVACSDSEVPDNENKNDENKNKFSIVQNINRMRAKMAQIKRKIFFNDKIFDDLDIKFCQNFMKKTISSKSLKMINYKTKRFSLQKNYVSTILGFLENNKSVNSSNTK